MSNPSSVYLAIDLGAGSGRVIAGVVREGKLSLEEVNRFENTPRQNPHGLFWGIEALWAGVLDGLKLAVATYGAGAICSIGVDAWGVDYGFINESGELLAEPRHYRDSRTHGVMEEVLEKVSEDQVFKHTGIQFMEINTLYQMFAEARDEGSPMPDAQQFLLIPDLINHRLTGRACCERTNASTTQFYNPTERDWSYELLESVGIPRHLTPELIDAGEVLGSVTAEISSLTGLRPETAVVTVGSHDTASAVAAVPAKPDVSFAYLSSGTWALLGVETDAPILSEAVRKYNFTNEVGVFDTVRLLKNINGLWLVQECRRVWAEQGEERSYQEMAAMALRAEPLTALIDPDEKRFSSRGDMPEAVQEFCRETGQGVPETPSQILRVVVESLAMKVRVVLEALEGIIGKRVDVLHIIGGGGQDEFLNQCIANSIQRPVIVGPYEATAAGNLMVQMVAAGELQSLEEGRAMIRESFETQRYEPQDSEVWDEAYRGFYHPG